MGGDDDDHHDAPLDPRLKLFESRVDSSLKSKPGVYEKMLSLDAYKARPCAIRFEPFLVGL